MKIPMPGRRLDLREADLLASLGLRLPGEAGDQRRLVCEHKRDEACEACIDYFLGIAYGNRNAPAGHRYLCAAGRHPKLARLRALTATPGPHTLLP